MHPNQKCVDYKVQMDINNVEINDESKENTIKFLETLEEDEDVQNVYSNYEIEQSL